MVSEVCKCSWTFQCDFQCHIVREQYAQCKICFSAREKFIVKGIDVYSTYKKHSFIVRHCRKLVVKKIVDVKSTG